ncbi:MAG: hypothetical protein ACK4NV_00720 [Pannonibacter sp.]
MVSKEVDEPMFRAAHLSRLERSAESRRQWQAFGKRCAGVLFLIVKNLLFWGSMLLSGYALYALAVWLF